VRALLDPAESPVRLLTLTGPGGVGKTRLALAAAAALADAYADGVVFVDLAPLRDHRLIAATIARALDVREGGGPSVSEVVLQFLRHRQLLLVLDIFERLPEGALLVTELLSACSQLAVLITSRTPLRVGGEQRFAVAPLATPVAQQPSTDAIVSAPAVRLFVARARAVQLDFALDATNERAVATLCRRLDGMPLAIELAAARVELLPPLAMLRRLERGQFPLTGGGPDRPERQRTLQRTLDWSYELLRPAEQALFGRLAVFAGGWTLEAAEAVCTDTLVPAEAVLERLQVLVDNSLVQRLDEVPGEPRFGMLETLREFALERLKARDESAQQRGRHAAYFLALAEEADPCLQGPDQVAWADRLEREQDNLRGALAWYAHSAQPLPGLRLAAALYQFWYMHGHYQEGRDRLLAALHAAGDEAVSEARGWALCALGYLEAMQGAYDVAWPHVKAAVELARQLQTRRLLGFARRCLLAFAAYGWTDQAEAHATVEEGLALYEFPDTDEDAGMCLIYRGDVALAAGEAEPARRFFEESSLRLRGAGSVVALAYPLRRLGYLALRQELPTRQRACAGRAWRSTATPAIPRGRQPVSSLSLRSLPPPGSPNRRRGCSEPAMPCSSQSAASSSRPIATSTSGPRPRFATYWMRPSSLLPGRRDAPWRASRRWHTPCNVEQRRAS
jgi:predicted ATPase